MLIYLFNEANFTLHVCIVSLYHSIFVRGWKQISSLVFTCVHNDSDLQEEVHYVEKQEGGQKWMKKITRAKENPYTTVELTQAANLRYIHM